MKTEILAFAKAFLDWHNKEDGAMSESMIDAAHSLIAAIGMEVNENPDGIFKLVPLQDNRPDQAEGNGGVTSAELPATIGECTPEDLDALADRAWPKLQAKIAAQYEKRESPLLLALLQDATDRGMNMGAAYIRENRDPVWWEGMRKKIPYWVISEAKEKGESNSPPPFP